MQEQMIFITATSKAQLVRELTRVQTAESVRGTMVMAGAAIDGSVLDSADYAGQPNLKINKNVFYYLDSEGHIAAVADSKLLTEALQSYVDTKVADLQQGVYFMGGASVLTATAADAAINALPSNVKEAGRGFMWVIGTAGSFDGTDYPYGGMVIGKIEEDGSITYSEDADDKTPTTNELEVNDTIFALTGAALSATVTRIDTLESGLTAAEDALTAAEAVALKFRRYQNRQTVLSLGYSSQSGFPSPFSASFDFVSGKYQIAVEPADAVGAGMEGGFQAFALEDLTGETILVEGTATIGESQAIFVIESTMTTPSEYDYIANRSILKAKRLIAIDDAFDASQYYVKTDVDSAISTAKAQSIAASAIDATTKANAAKQNARDYSDATFDTSAVVDEKVSDAANAAEQNARDYSDATFDTSAVVDEKVSDAANAAEQNAKDYSDATFDASEVVDGKISDAANAAEQNARDYSDATFNTSAVVDEKVSDAANAAEQNAKDYSDATFDASEVVDGKISALETAIDIAKENVAPRVAVTLKEGTNYVNTTGIITIPVGITALTAEPIAMQQSVVGNEEFPLRYKSLLITGGNLVIQTNPALNFDGFRIVYKGN
jgi:hypothetical protein